MNSTPTPDSDKASRLGARKTVLFIGALTLIGVAFLFLPIGHWIENARGYIKSLGWLAPIAYVAAYIVCTVMLIPASALTIAAGGVFGLLEGTLLTIVGSNIGAICSFLLARTI